MKNRLIEIINILKEVKKELNLDISDSDIFQEATSYHRGELANLNRQGYNIQNQKKPQNNPITSPNKPILDDKPSEKQIVILQKFKVPNIDKLTKKQAQDIIRDKFEKPKQY